MTNTLFEILRPTIQATLVNGEVIRQINPGVWVIDKAPRLPSIAAIHLSKDALVCFESPSHNCCWTGPVKINLDLNAPDSMRDFQLQWVKFYCNALTAWDITYSGD